jgi:hypothetical protein
MRRISCISGAAVLLAFPASAAGFSGTYTGDLAGDTDPTYSLAFSARVKERPIPTRVRKFRVTAQFSCFDAAGTQVSSTRRNDLAPGFIDGLRVSRKGRFRGTSPTATGLTYVVTGRLRRDDPRANGTLQITQGTKGADGYCSTGSFVEPTVPWTALYHPNSCCAQPEVVASRPSGP